MRLQMCRNTHQELQNLSRASVPAARVISCPEITREGEGEERATGGHSANPFCLPSSTHAPF